MGCVMRKEYAGQLRVSWPLMGGSKNEATAMPLIWLVVLMSWTWTAAFEGGMFNGGAGMA